MCESDYDVSNVHVWEHWPNIEIVKLEDVSNAVVIAELEGRAAGNNEFAFASVATCQ
jgi:hypothetical protein